MLGSLYILILAFFLCMYLCIRSLNEFNRVSQTYRKVYSISKNMFRFSCFLNSWKIFRKIRNLTMCLGILSACTFFFFTAKDKIFNDVVYELNFEFPKTHVISLCQSCGILMTAGEKSWNAQRAILPWNQYRRGDTFL